MKKLILVIMLIILVGCEKEPFQEIKNIKEETPAIKEDTYVDENNLKVGLYTRSNGKYTLWHEYSAKITSNKDINTFQILPSNEEVLTYTGKYVNFIEPLWNSIESEYKLGIILEYELQTKTKIKHVIYDPSNILEYQDYIQVYLYDAIAHKNDKWYSHITNEEFNENTYITSFKLTAGKLSNEIVYPIKLSVFTYDTDDDFDELGIYRGNSIYTINVTNQE